MDRENTNGRVQHREIVANAMQREASVNLGIEDLGQGGCQVGIRAHSRDPCGGRFVAWLVKADAVHEGVRVVVKGRGPGLGLRPETEERTDQLCGPDRRDPRLGTKEVIGDEEFVVPKLWNRR